MKNLLIKALASSGLLLLTMTASGQPYPRPQYPDRSQVQDGREARDNDRLFDRIRGDLDRAHDWTLPFTADRDRVVMARERADACRRAISAGAYDRRMLDDTVAAIRRVIDLNRLSDQSRDYLITDLEQLRSLQARLEGY
jgi:hypothetical protein